ncbi:hypothetical protein LguiA_018011 [Lonicera macranthoides]
METRVRSGTSSTAPPQHDMISGARDLFGRIGCASDVIGRNDCAGYVIGSNEDLLRTLLIHIPNYKPLTTFKSVSKLWLSLISDPGFSLRWYKNHMAYPSAVLIYRHCSYEFISLNGREKKGTFLPYFGFDCHPLLNHSRHRIEILHSCNGLLLLNLKVKVNHEWYESRLGVYNSITNHSKLIPKFFSEFSYFTSYTKLAFHPLKSPHYKLVTVIVVLYQDISHEEMLIYSSESDSWKILPPRFTNSYGLMFEAGVYWNGAIHWPCEVRRHFNSLYFDVDKECCVWMPLPPIQGIDWKRNIKYFGESGGHLHLIDYKEGFTLQFNVFEMEKDCSKWFVKYNVDLVTLGRGVIKRFIFLSLVLENGDGVGGGEEESTVLVMYVPVDGMVISYNLKNGKLKKLCPLQLSCWEMDKLKETNNWLMVHQIAY